MQRGRIEGLSGRRSRQAHLVVTWDTGQCDL